MPIVYAQFTVSFHGMRVTTAQMEALAQALLAAATPLHPDYPNLRFESDIEVEWVEHAGTDDTSEA